MSLEQQLAALPFDTESMVTRLRSWIECESPSYDASAVNRMMTIAAEEMVAMGGRVERIPGMAGMADCIRATFSQSGEPGILAMGHLDTVHPVDTVQQLPWRREGGRCYGPGILDMKGGNFIVLEALRQLKAAGIPTGLPVTVLFTSDEEIGSPSTRALIETEAARHKYVLIPEPARPNGGVVTGRYAIARMSLRATGTPSHAGGHLSQGRSAIRVMAEKLIELEQMTCEDFTFSVGVINGGKWVNCVARECTGEALSMAKTQADLDMAISRAKTLVFENAGASFSVDVTATRPIWDTTDGTMQLYEVAKEEAGRIGFSLPHQLSGGGSDGNFTGALGMNTLDGLGLRGAGMHTLNEYIEEDSLVERARLMAGLLARLN